MRARFLLKVSLILLLFLISACSFFTVKNEVREETISNELMDFSINPDTVLDSVDWGDFGGFVRILTRPDSSSTATVLWSSEDYLKTADFLHKNLWQDGIWDDTLVSMGYEVPCENIEQGGFSHVVMQTSKLRRDGEDVIRIIENIFISPSLKYVDTQKIELTLSDKQYDIMNPKQIFIPPETAMKIAEENGGRNARDTFGKPCEVAVAIDHWGGPKPKWLISYTALPMD